MHHVLVSRFALNMASIRFLPEEVGACLAPV
jgi:hypothetical protein